MNPLKPNINSYYKQKQMIARVDRQGNILGQIEKWEAHRKGILHKAFTVAIIYKNICPWAVFIPEGHKKFLPNCN